MYGTAFITWNPPRTIERIKKLGFFERNDISRYDVWYKKASDSGNGTVLPHYREGHEFRLTGLEIDVDYLARVRAVDYGEQEGDWSGDFKFKLGNEQNNFKNLNIFNS
jgi:hypothetical protein